jgi:hypothetical protein
VRHKSYQLRSQQKHQTYRYISGSRRLLQMECQVLGAAVLTVLPHQQHTLRTLHDQASCPHQQAASTHTCIPPVSQTDAVLDM